MRTSLLIAPAGALAAAPRTLRGLLVLLLALAVPSAAAAAKFTFTVNGTSPITVPGVTLTGDDQTRTFTMRYTIAYTGGKNTAGWHVDAASTPLAAGTTMLPPLEVTDVTQAGCTGKNCVDPTNSVTWPVTLGTVATTIYDAAANTGRGTVALTATYQVSYPANALQGTYSATLTLTGAAGP